MKKQKFAKWFKAAIVRAIRTWAQTFIAMVPASAVVINDLNFKLCISGATLAAILAIITAIAGLPEVEGEEDIV